ncbi:MAG: adenylate/guanylate cyclase domain-containing protein [Candidatus Krumholzibacteriia bacterium]
MPDDRGPYRYTPPPPSAARRACLEPLAPTATGERFGFHDHLVIGRDLDGADPRPGELRLHDPSVSRRHCELTRAADGRLFVRDLSTNGVWLDGRRLLPNQEVEIRPGQVLAMGAGHLLRLAEEGCAPAEATTDLADLDLTTVRNASHSQVTVLVGDIRGYTRMVTAADPATVERSVSALFQFLHREVSALGGTLKEYPGDAIFAFWEDRGAEPSALAACRAAVTLDRRVRTAAADPALWNVPAFPLAMDWALATGAVIIQTLGDDRPVGLSMVGAPVILAFRLEKLADADTGPILVCGATRAAVGEAFAFRDLGEVTAAGFERPQRAFALVLSQGSRGVATIEG